jgi:hypothetical protein
MRVVIKKFQVDLEVKTKGIEFAVRTPDDQSQVGDCLLTKTGLTWCRGKKNAGVKIKWPEFIEIMKSREAKEAALRAARDA